MSGPPTVRHGWRWSAALFVCLGCASGAPNRLDGGQGPDADAAPFDAAMPPRDAGARDAAAPEQPEEDAGSEDAGDARVPPPTDEDGGGEDAAVGPCDDGSARGDCGCPGEAGAAAQGSACDDGDCPLSSQCDGEGSCGSAADCQKPDSSCGNVMLQHAGHYYYVCPALKTWDDARAACRTNPHFDLIRVDDASEQGFLETSVTSLTNDTWINATDTTTPDSWAWMDDGTVFWMGTSTGAAVSGLYNDWFTGEPSASGDCARHTVIDSAWRDSACSEMHFFVCEAAPP